MIHAIYVEGNLTRGLPKGLTPLPQARIWWNPDFSSTYEKEWGDPNPEAIVEQILATPSTGVNIVGACQWIVRPDQTDWTDRQYAAQMKRGYFDIEPELGRWQSIFLPLIKRGWMPEDVWSDDETTPQWGMIEEWYKLVPKAQRTFQYAERAFKTASYNTHLRLADAVGLPRKAMIVANAASVKTENLSPTDIKLPVIGAQASHYWGGCPTRWHFDRLQRQLNTANRPCMTVNPTFSVDHMHSMLQAAHVSPKRVVVNMYTEDWMVPMLAQHEPSFIYWTTN